MMARPLPQWCKNVKIELVRRDMSISDLAKLVGLTKQYTSGIVSGTITPKPLSRTSAMP